MLPFPKLFNCIDNEIECNKCQNNAYNNGGDVFGPSVPKGMIVIGWFREILPPIKTMAEVITSEIECQASAIKAKDPVEMPAQYFKPDNTTFPTMENHPARRLYFFRSSIFSENSKVTKFLLLVLQKC